MTRISDGRTKFPASHRKVFDYRKHDLNDLIIENYDIAVTLMFADVLGARDLVIRNNKVRHARECSEQPFGVILKSTVNALIEGNVFEGFRATDTGYPRGDGGCGERTSNGTRWINNQFLNNADGGLDTKGVDEVIEGNLSQGNYRSFRLWGNGRMSRNVSSLPRNAHLWFSLGTDVSGNWDVADQMFTDDKAPHLMIDSGKRGRVITLLDATIGGISVRDEKDLIIQRNGTGKLVELDVRQTPKTPETKSDYRSLMKLPDGDGDGKIRVSSAQYLSVITPRPAKGTVVEYAGQNSAGEYLYNRVKS